MQTKEMAGNGKAAAAPFGVHSEVGKLRKVMVCRPGLAHLRLTPDNCKDLLFDDVIWVQEAKNEHYKFVEVMRDRGIDVVDMHDLLAKTLEDPEAKKWVLDRKINPNRVLMIAMDELRGWLELLPPAELAEYLIGGIATSADGTDVRLPTTASTVLAWAESWVRLSADKELLPGRSP